MFLVVFVDWLVSSQIPIKIPSTTTGTFRRCCTSAYDVARLHLVTPMDFWQNSTPCFGVAAFCMTKINDFRRIEFQEPYGPLRNSSPCGGLALFAHNIFGSFNISCKYQTEMPFFKRLQLSDRKNLKIKLIISDLSSCSSCCCC